MRQEVSPSPYVDMVREFMETVGQPAFLIRRKPSISELNFRYHLFMEEATELMNAIEANDQVEQLDAICDILYILAGTKLTFGNVWTDTPKLAEMNVYSPALVRVCGLVQTHVKDLMALSVDDYDEAIFKVFDIAHKLGFCKIPGLIRAAFKAVHESNMSKTCTDIGVAGKTVKSYQREGVDAFFEKRSNGRFVIYRTADRKVLKSIYYKPVNLKPFIEELAKYGNDRI